MFSMKVTLVSVALLSLVACDKKSPPNLLKLNLPKASKRGPIGKPISLALGGEHSCALFDSGQVMCWGASTDSQLGDTDGKKIKATHPHLLPLISDAIAIDSDNNQTCVLQKAGSVVCFGSDGGQKNMRIVQNVVGAKSIAISESGGCARKDEAIYCWGKADKGQIPGVLESRLKRAKKIEKSYSKISASGSSFFGKSAMGWEGWGGNPGRIFRKVSQELNGFTKIKGSAEFDNIISRDAVACGITSKDVRCWGRLGNKKAKKNEVGGDATMDVAEIKAEGISGKISKVVLGEQFGCALADRKIWCWGSNSQGTLGDGTRQSRALAMPVKTLESVEDVDAGDAHVCAIDKGQVFCWGDSRYSQIGVDSHLVKTEPVLLHFEDSAGKIY